MHLPIVAFLLFLTTTGRGQYEHPVNWRLVDLQRLEVPCVQGWRVELDKRQRPAMDSTMEWCLCYDQSERRMDAQYWWTVPRPKGGVDTLEWTNLHRWFAQDGSVAFDADHSRMSSFGSDTTETIRTTKVEQGKKNSRMREIHSTYHGDAMRSPSYWFVDSLIIRNDTLSTHRRYYTGGLNNEVHMDSTILYRHRGILGVVHEVSYRNGRKYHSVTRRFEGPRLVYRVDSIFDRPALDGRTGALLEEAAYEYMDSLLVREVHRTVNDEEDTWQLSLCADIRYVYSDGKLKKIKYRNAKGRRVKSPEFEYSSDLEVPTPWFKDPFLNLSNSGLPIVISSDYGDGPSHLLRFVYLSERPDRIPNGDTFKAMRFFEPR